VATCFGLISPSPDQHSDIQGSLQSTHIMHCGIPY